MANGKFASDTNTFAGWTDAQICIGFAAGNCFGSGRLLNAPNLNAALNYLDCKIENMNQTAANVSLEDVGEFFPFVLADPADPASGFKTVETALAFTGECLADLKSRVTVLEGDAIQSFTILNNEITIEQVDGDLLAVTVSNPVLSTLTNPDGTVSLTVDGTTVLTTPVVTVEESADGLTHSILSNGVVVGTFSDNDTVSSAHPDYTFTENAAGDLEVREDGVLIATITDSDTVSPPAPTLTFAPNATNGTDVMIDGVVVYVIPDNGVVISQTAVNEWTYFQDGVAVGIIDTIPDTDQALVPGAVTVNLDGSVEVCLTTVWVTPPDGVGAGTAVTAPDDKCFTIPAPSASNVAFNNPGGLFGNANTVQGALEFIAAQPDQAAPDVAYSAADAAGPLGAANDVAEALDLANDCLKTIKPQIAVIETGLSNVTTQLNTLSFTVDATGDLLTIVYDGTTYTFDDEDTVSTPNTDSTFTVAGNGDVTIDLDGTAGDLILPAHVFLDQPDTTVVYVAGTQTVNANGSVTQCLNPVWGTPPAGANSGDATGGAAVCWTIPDDGDVESVTDGGSNLVDNTDPDNPEIRPLKKCGGANFDVQTDEVLSKGDLTDNSRGHYVPYVASAADACAPEPLTGCAASLTAITVNPASGKAFGWNPATSVWSPLTANDIKIQRFTGQFAATILSGPQVYNGAGGGDDVVASFDLAPVVINNPDPCRIAIVTIQANVAQQLMIDALDLNTSYIRANLSIGIDGNFSAIASTNRIQNSFERDDLSWGTQTAPGRYIIPAGGSISLIRRLQYVHSAPSQTSFWRAWGVLNWTLETI